jgi:hypothetical protein
VQLLAQTLLDEGQDSAAAVWLRWALRVSPRFAIDTVRFLPQVAAAYEAARELVTRTSIPGDTAVETSWRWGAPTTEHDPGRLEVASGSVPDSVQLSAEGVGFISPGAGASTTPGSYLIRAWAAGHDSVRVTREVLPGVATVLRVRLQPSARPVPPMVVSQQPSVVAPAHKKRFPWVWAALGAAGAGTLVAVLGGGSNPPPPPSTGGIIIPFPFP